MNAQDMEALRPMVDEVDGQSPQAQAQAAEQASQEAQQQTEAQAWAVIPTTVGKLVCMFAPELAPIYSAESCQAWGQDMAAVAAKRNWESPSALPEVGLLISTAGFAVPSYMVIKAKLQAIEKARKDAAPVDIEAREVKPSPAGADAVTGAHDGS